MDREARDGASSSPSGKGEPYSREGVLLRRLKSLAKAGLFLFDQFYRVVEIIGGADILARHPASPYSSAQQMPNPTPLEPPPRSWPWRPLLPPLLAVVICIIVG